MRKYTVEGWSKEDELWDMMCLTFYSMATLTAIQRIHSSRSTGEVEELRGYSSRLGERERLSAWSGDHKKLRNVKLYIL